MAHAAIARASADTFAVSERAPSIWWSAGLFAALPVGVLGAAIDSAWVAAFPWILSLGVIGMPHGGYDIELLRRAARPWHSIGVYVMVMVASGAALAAAPTVTLIGFLLLAVHHFGTSDSPPARERPRPDVAAVLGGWGRSLLVIAAPFAAHGGWAWEPFALLATPTTMGQPATDDVHRFASVAGGIGLGVGVVLVAINAKRLARRGRWGDVAEEISIGIAALALGVLTAPLFAVGSYFLLAHALRHCLTARVPGTRPRIGWMHRLWYVHRRSAWFTVPASVTAVAWGLLLGGACGATALAAGFIGVCVIGTLPHHLLWTARFGRP